MVRHGWPTIWIVLGVDVAFHTVPLQFTVTVGLDELAHLATVILALGAASSSLPRSFVIGGVVGALALNLDHLAITFGVHALAPTSGRPYTHSLATALIVLAAAGVAGRGRPLLAGAAIGVASHLLRDLVTGVEPLFWPISSRQLTFSYDLYFGVILLLAGYVFWRDAEQHLRHNS